MKTMNTRSFTFGAIALAGFATLVAPNKIEAQPMNDRVVVNLPYSVTIGDKILQPGNYTIQELDSIAGKSPVLVIYGDNGMQFETSAMTIPALENRTQPDTRVLLHHIGNDYYFDKIWIQGEDYGYEFVLPKNVIQREDETVYASANAATTASATAPPAPAAELAPAPEPAPAPADVPAPEPAPATVQPETQPDNTANREMTEPAPAPVPAPAPELTPAPAADETPAMPHTDAGWLMMLLSGGTLTGLGASLRRKR
jgi:hypothetical protein